MEWNSETLDRLSKIFGNKSREIHGEACPRPGRVEIESALYERAWTSYLLELGLKMESAGQGSERRSLVHDGKVRIVNAWGNRYIDVPEDFAIRTLVLGFLP